MLGLSKEVRGHAGVDAGDDVQVALELDLAERTVDLPPALAEALARDPDASVAYDRLAYTHRKEFANWVAEAKRERRATGGSPRRSKCSAPGKRAADLGVRRWRNPGEAA